MLIESFADKDTRLFYMDGQTKKLLASIQARALRKLDMVDNAYVIDDLRVPPGNRLHSLQGDRAGQYSISINDQWRICFEFHDGNAYEVEICDYH